MRPVTGIISAALLAATVAGCSSESYYSPAPRTNYGYTQAYAPGYTTYQSSPGYYSTPGSYRTTTYQTSYAQPSSYPQRGGYDGYWDYQRNYRGIHAAPEL